MGNSLWRLTTTIDLLASSLERLGRLEDVEVLVVDWGSAVPLHRVLGLSPAGQSITRFLVVPPEVHHEVRGDSDFPDSIALNVGVRRARGRFICQLGNDVLLTVPFCAGLLDILDGRSLLRGRAEETLMLFRRKHIPYEVVEKSPTVDTLTEFITRFDSHLPAEPLSFFLYGSSGGMLMSRRLWFTCRGFNESLPYWGWNDIDLSLRVRLRHHLFPLDGGLFVYHLQHYSAPGDKPLRRHRLNPHVFSPFEVNPASWGLEGRSFEEVPAASFPLPDPPPFLGPSRPEDHRRVHVWNLLREVFARARRPGDVFSMLVISKEMTMSLSANRWLRGAVERIRIPDRLRPKTAPFWERRFSGPWNQPGSAR
jgi:hypothetical protein